MEKFIEQKVCKFKPCVQGEVRDVKPGRPTRGGGGGISVGCQKKREVIFSISSVQGVWVFLGDLELLFFLLCLQTMHFINCISK